MTAAIEIAGLVKAYGENRALDGVDLQVAEGSVYGFLGPNGAGKTTTLRILSGLARPTEGEARVFGHDVVGSSADVRATIGYLPDVPGFYDWMTGPEFLRFAGRLFGLEGAVLGSRVSGLLEMAGLDGVRTRIGGYSRGMKQRLGVAQALVNAPKLLLLDEPTSALDPIGRKDVLDMVAALSGRTTVFFSTHILADVERVCDTVAVLDRGRVVEQASVSDLKTRHGSTRLILVVTGDATALGDRLAREPWVTGVETTAANTLVLAVGDIDAARHAVPAAVAGSGLGMVRFDTLEVSLEDVFVGLVGGGA
jgi:ABC-2 type transport system ATP-binding protein